MNSQSVKFRRISCDSWGGIQRPVTYNKIASDFKSGRQWMTNVDNLLESLRGMRSPEKFHNVFECALLVAELLNITLVKPRTAMRSVYRTAAGGAETSVEDYFRINVYYPTLHNIVIDVELRFGPTQKKASKLARLVPFWLLELLTTKNGHSCKLQWMFTATCYLIQWQ